MKTNKMPTHTPGPWEQGVGDEGEAQVYGSDGYRRIILASTENFRIATDESKANARLIAAAPELLDALKEAVRELDLRCAFYGNAFANMRAAIRKAEGN
jgi:hypothetical protein